MYTIQRQETQETPRGVPLGSFASKPTCIPGYRGDPSIVATTMGRNGLETESWEEEICDLHLSFMIALEGDHITYFIYAAQYCIEYYSCGSD